MTLPDRPPARLPDPSRSRAVLVGPREYKNLNPLPAVPRNLERLQAILTDPDLWGLPAEHCVVLDAPESTDVVLDALMEAGRAASDALVFYFAGHGLLDPADFRLFLALGGAGVGPVHGAIAYEDVRARMSYPSCNAKIVILDCCYSGQALAGMAGPDRLSDLVGIDGSLVYTACAENALAMAPEGEPFTAFSGELMKVFEEGIPDAGELLDFETVHWRVRGNLVSASRPRPYMRFTDFANSLALVRNRAHFVTETMRSVPLPSAVERRIERVISPAIPSVPAPVPHRPRLTPTALIERLVALEGSGQLAEADALLGSAVLGRPAQETADLLRRLGHDDSDRVVVTAAEQSPTEVSELLTILHDLGWTDLERRVEQAVGVHDTDRVIKIAERLKPDARDRLLYDVAMSSVGNPEMIIRLVGLLSSTSGPMDEALTILLNRLAGAVPATDAAVIADALRSADRQLAAFKLYEAALPAILDRRPDELISLAASMYTRGRHRQALSLIEKAALTCVTADRAESFIRALRVTAVPALIADDAITLISTVLPDDELLDLTRRMIRHDQDIDARRVTVQAAARRGIESVITYVRALQDAGRPVDAMHLIVKSATRAPSDILVVLLDLVEQNKPDLVVKLLEGEHPVSVWGPGKIADIVLETDVLHIDVLRALASFLNTLKPADVLAVALELIRAARRRDSRRLLAACAEILTPAFDEKTCVSYTRLTPAPAAEPSDSGKRATRARALTRERWELGATSRDGFIPSTPIFDDPAPEPAPAPRISIPPHPEPVYPRPLSRPGSDPQGIAERAALAVDLIAALPHKIVQLTAMTDGGTEGAATYFADAMLAAGPGNFEVVMSVFTGGEPGFVIAAIERISEAAGAAESWAALGTAIEQVGTAESTLLAVLPACSPRAIAVQLSGLSQVAPKYRSQALARIGRGTHEERRIVIAVELAKLSQQDLAQHLLVTDATVSSDAANQAGIIAVRRYIRAGTPSARAATPGVELQVGRARIIFDETGVRLRKGSVFWNGEPSIKYRELAGSTVSWNGSDLIIDTGRRYIRWPTGWARRESGRAAALTLTQIARFIQTVVKLCNDYSVS